jgi:hypothetical protein
VLHDELELLQAPVGLLRGLGRLAVLGAARLRFGGPLIRARELLDLLPGPPNVAPEGVDDRVELGFEVVAVFDEAGGFSARVQSMNARFKARR